MRGLGAILGGKKKLLRRLYWCRMLKVLGTGVKTLGFRDDFQGGGDGCYPKGRRKAVSLCLTDFFEALGG